MAALQSFFVAALFDLFMYLLLILAGAPFGLAVYFWILFS